MICSLIEYKEDPCVFDAVTEKKVKGFQTWNGKNVFYRFLKESFNEIKNIDKQLEILRMY